MFAGGLCCWVDGERMSEKWVVNEREYGATW